MSISNILKSRNHDKWLLEGETLNLTGTVNSISSTTGTLIVSGGAGFGNDIHVNGYVYSLGSGGDSENLHLTGTTVSSSPSSGTLIVDGGAGFGNDIHVNGYVYSLGSGGDTENLHLTGTIESSSPSTGTLIVDGGVGIVKNLNVSGVERITNITVSTSQTTGSLVVNGGVGVGGDICLKGTLKGSIYNIWSFLFSVSGCASGTINGEMVQVGNIICIQVGGATFDVTSDDYLFLSGVSSDFPKVDISGSIPIVVGVGTSNVSGTYKIAHSNGGIKIAYLNETTFSTGASLTIPSFTITYIIDGFGSS